MVLPRVSAQLLAWVTAAVMLLALVGNLYPVPEGPYGKLPYIYFAYLVAGMLWFFWRVRNGKTAVAEGEIA